MNTITPFSSFSPSFTYFVLHNDNQTMTMTSQVLAIVLTSDLQSFFLNPAYATRQELAPFLMISLLDRYVVSDENQGSSLSVLKCCCFFKYSRPVLVRYLKELLKHANFLQEIPWRLFLLPFKSIVVIGCHGEYLY